MTDPASHAARYLDNRKLDASPTNLAIAHRAVARAGRLADLGAHMIPGILRVTTVETGGPDYMAAGSIFARVVLDAPELGWSAEAVRAREQLEARAAERGLRIMVAMYRATKRDRRRDRRRCWLRRWGSGLGL